MAYTKTKAQITTFRLVTRYTSLDACQNLPEEVISMIAGNVRETVFTTEMKEWIKIRKCLTNACGIMAHVSQAELDDFAGMFTSSIMEDDEWLEEQFIYSAAKKHRKLVKQDYDALTNSNKNSRIAKCRRVRNRTSLGVSF